MAEQLAAEKDDREKAALAEQLKKIEDSIRTIEKSINIVDILEKTEGK